MTDGDLKKPHLARKRGHLPLVLRIVVAVHEHDGGRLDAVCPGVFEIVA